MKSPEIDGGCYCGGLRYRITQTPQVSLLCHCEDCRRTSGASPVAWITVPFTAFSWMGEEPARYRSSPPVERTFCGRCGASLTYTHEDNPDAVDVATATLDDPEAFPPTRETFTEDRLSWLPALLPSGG